jgi:beta-lactamase superfamily II metal-dependent hydrolase
MSHIALCMLFAVAALQAAPLKIHFLDVADGDCEIICSPDGKNVLIDAGSKNTSKCKDIIEFCNAKNIAQFDYAIVSHYDPDHINCVPELAARLSPNGVVFDRGEPKDGRDSGTYAKYANAVGSKRKTAVKGEKIVLDDGKLAVVTAALNGNGVSYATNENDLSIVAVLHYGRFDASFGGDIAGYDSTRYKNIETSVARSVGGIEVYKAHNHCAKNTANPVWLHVTHPQIAILSVGPWPQYNHPSEYCVDRLHKAGVDCFWTEKGAGVPPDSFDHIWGNITIEVNDDGTAYTVSGSGGSKTYQCWSDAPVMASRKKNKSITPGITPTFSPVSAAGAKYEWSVKGKYYHVKDCPATKTIKDENRMTGDAPPAGKEKHSCVN